LPEVRHLILASFLVTACVAGTEQRPSSADVAEGPPPIPAEPSAGGVLAGAEKTQPDPEPGPRPGPDQVYVRGHWHWTGTRYSWIPGHWEAQNAAYAPAVGR
jgi:hypothetical protein